MSEHELGTSLSQNKIKQFIEESSEKKVESTQPDVVKTYQNKEQLKNFSRTKILLMISLGFLSAIFSLHDQLAHPRNVFVIFLLIDLTFNLKFFSKKNSIDRCLYD